MAAVEDNRHLLTDLFGELERSIDVNQSVYKKHATLYDKAFSANGFSLPQQLANLIKKNLGEKAQLSECKILDIGPGTGLSGRALREAGFCGVIDAVEGCAEMREEALKKNIYREIIQQVITLEQHIPLDDDSYDVIMCSGVLSFGHVPHECLRDMMRVLRPGGILVCNGGHFKGTDPDAMVDDSIRKVLVKMVDEGKCQFLEEINTQIFETDVKYHMVAYVQLYCCRKAFE